MNVGTGQTISPWMASASQAAIEPLPGNVTADVCVVGAGITGLSAAYLLAREGSRVVVLDDSGVGTGETARTTAHITHVVDWRYAALEQVHGEEIARLVAGSHTSAISRIEQIVAEEGIECDFRRVDGFLMAADPEDREALNEEVEASHRAGLRHVSIVKAAPLPGFDSGPCLICPHQAQFHPLRYLSGLARAIEKRGGRIFRSAHVVDVDGSGPIAVQTREGPKVSAGSVIVATSAPISEAMGVNLRLAAFRSYVIGARVATGSVPAALYWDTGDPYHYMRLTSEKDGSVLLIAGGEGHRVGQGPGGAGDSDERFARLEGWVRERVPGVGETHYRWSGEWMETIDGLAFIGPQEKNGRVYTAAGFSGTGMTYGTIAGILLTDLIQGRENRWAQAYDPARHRLGSLGKLAKEGLANTARYASHLGPGDVASVAEILPASGAVVRRGLKLIAAYRDESGTLHEMSAVCPHMKCLVQWNALESSWDCPCHGSRFDACGKVLHGPAVSDLRGADCDD